METKNHECQDSDYMDRPLITFALFAYNQEQYIEEAVQGALSQTYSPLSANEDETASLPKMVYNDGEEVPI